MNCVLCGSRAETILVQDLDPVLSNRLYGSAHEARNAPTGRLDIAACSTCGFIFNKAFDPRIVTYDPRYENDQARSPSFAEHMSNVANRVLDRTKGDESARVVEIGCGQAQFLAMLASRADGKLEITGFDPAFRGGPVPPGVRIERRLFDRGTVLELGAPPAVVVARHVIEHVPNPVAFLASIRAALPSAWTGTLFIETPSVEWILDHAALYDFFYEHCNYFTGGALRRCLDAAGFEVLDLERIFDDQYFLATAEARPTTRAVPTGVNGHTGRAAAEQLGRWQQDFVADWNSRLEEASRKGRIAVWGAGAKGITFTRLLDPSAERIACLVDINPGKQALFTPITAHPVANPVELSERGIGTVVVMNPRYRREVEADLASMKLDADILVA
jgi:hypothetical protein